jgi:hypothetical protein
MDRERRDAIDALYRAIRAAASPEDRGETLEESPAAHGSDVPL